MGNGTFDIETAIIPPVLVLLDRHGWEIMRKPLPQKDTYPYGDELKDLEVYDSPLVKEYKFYSNASKAYGCHKYALRLDDKKKERDQIKVDGKQFTSTSLADLPPLTASGVLSSGVLNDQYVTYTVKDEYEDNYDYNLTLNKEAKTFTETGTSLPYLVLQDGRFYKAENTLTTTSNPSYLSKPIIEHTDPEGGNVYDLIVSPYNHGGTNNNIIYADGVKKGEFIGNNFWRVMPNLDIDEEMGIVWTSETDTTKFEPYTRYVTKEKYENRTGFDPYNIQLQLINDNDGNPDGRYMTTHMTSTSIENGAMKGDYSESGGTEKITLEVKRDATNPEDANLVHSEGYDHSDIKMTNQTFMAVSDANGNMQLMPRFDHSLRVDLANSNPWETTLKAPKDNGKKASAEDNRSMGTQTTFFVPAKRFHYHIIDDFGREALRYKRGGDFYPAITEHFKSPLAKDFTYYTGLAEHGATEIIYETEWDSAPDEFKRTVTTETLMNSQINLLPTSGTYFYQIGTRGVFTYKKVTVTKGLLEQEITGSFADAELDDFDCHVYVRYKYDEDADNEADRILQGQWFTVKLSEKDLQAYGSVTVPVGATQGTGVDLYAGADDSRSLTAENNEEYAEKRDALPQIGDYYFRIGEEDSYTYKKVNVNTVPISSASHYTETTDDGTFESKWSNSKPLTMDADGKKWQWKFLQAPTDPSSDYYVEPDPYAIQIFNRFSNYTINPSLQPSPMAIGIKVPNANDGADRFALLSHPSGGYALVVAKEYDRNYNYQFLNGENMTIPSTTAATVFLGNPQKTTVADEDAYNTAKAALTMDGEYYYKYGNGDEPVTYTYKKIIRTSGANTETASDKTEWESIDTNRFTYKDNKLNTGTQLLISNDVTHDFKYHVINNSSKLAVSANQTTEEAAYHEYFPYLPEAIQTPLLREKKDYKYYGFANHIVATDTYTVIPQTILYTLAGLYDDDVWVRYEAYDMDSTTFKIPNKKTVVAGKVARDPSSIDVSMNIKGELPYNIIWENDNMMKAVDTSEPADGTYEEIGYDASHDLSGNEEHIWYFTGNDPYALKIKHKKGMYVNGTSALAAEGKEFMLLKKSDYDYGILQETGGTNKLSDYGQTTEPGDPTKFIVFGLSIHDLIYRLVIAKTCELSKKSTATSDQYVDIPYSDKNPTPYDPDYNPETGKLRVYGSTQRDLTSVNTGGGTHYPGEKYQLGTTLSWNNPKEYHTYCYDAGSVSIGDILEVPNVFNRPNCTYEFYIEGVYQNYADPSDSNQGKPYTELNDLYKGMKLKNLMADEKLINQDVVVNIVYSFDKSLATNSGLDFVRSIDQNLWYTYETQSGTTPYMAHYTNAWGMQSMEGRDTRYTNDYLWTPLGDVYGFKMYNRYMIKNSGADDKVMTYAGDAAAGKKLVVAKPGDDEPEPGTETYTKGNEIFELLSGDDPNSGNFRVHPVVNTGETKYYVIRNSSNDNYTELSTTPCDWTFGLDMTLLEPYYDRAGYVGGLTTTAKKPLVQPKSGKELYEEVLAEEPFKIIDLQAVVYNDDNIVDFSKGYYRLHSVPGTPGIDPVRYASGYLHDIERDQDKDGSESDAIPMHFYSKVGITGTFDGGTSPLESGFTVTNATRGDIPVPATEDDPSTIFYLDGGKNPSDLADGVNPRVFISTQGLYVKGIVPKIEVDEEEVDDPDHGDAVMTATKGDATEFSLIDIGGAVLLITNELAPATRKYLHYGQDYIVGGDNKIYDLKYYHNSPINEARWCIEPANNKGLKVAVNNGNDDYYYSTFCAPYDVKLPDNDGTKTYYAYTCDKWDEKNLHPTKVPAVTGTSSYDEGKFVPAGTPVIFRIKDESGSMKLTIEGNKPSDPLPSSSNIFSGKYLEQLLPLDAGNKWLYDVYTLGLPFKSNVNKDGYYDDNGDIHAPSPEQEKSGVGFYINANPNKEINAMKANWSRNNRYVLHNKIYYREGATSGSSARGMTRGGVEFVPLIFDWEDVEEDGYGHMEEEELTERREYVGDGCVYDMQGRRVATEEQVLDGTWKQRVSPGIYIINGKKISVN